MLSAKRLCFIFFLALVLGALNACGPNYSDFPTSSTDTKEQTSDKNEKAKVEEAKNEPLETPARVDTPPSIKEPVIEPVVVAVEEEPVIEPKVVAVEEEPVIEPKVAVVEDEPVIEPKVAVVEDEPVIEPKVVVVEDEPTPTTTPPPIDDQTTTNPIILPPTPESEEKTVSEPEPEKEIPEPTTTPSAQTEDPLLLEEAFLTSPKLLTFSHEDIGENKTMIFAESKPIAVYGKNLVVSPFHEGSSKSRARQLSQAWISEYAAQFGLEDLQIIETNFYQLRTKNTYIFEYRQTIESLFVENSIGKVVVQNGKVLLGNLRFAKAPEDSVSWLNAISREEALSAVKSISEYSDLNEWEDLELVYYFNENLRSTWETALKVWKVRGKNLNRPSREYTFYIDARSGEIVSARQDVTHTNVTGSVTGNATPGTLPDQLGNAAAGVNLENLTVSIAGGNSDETNSVGAYDIVHAGTAAVTVNTALQGPWVTAIHEPGPSTLSFSQAGVVPPGPQNFVFNSVPSEFTTAQVNVFLHTGFIHNYIKDRAPSFTQIDFQIDANVNLDDLGGVFCNAFFSPGAQNINFYRAGGGCNNAAYSTIIAHEYGHFVVNRLQLSQGSFGEGYSDTLAMLAYDVSGIGEDFSGVGSGFTRSEALTDLAGTVYPCVAANIYTCGNILSAVWWNIRLNLVATHGAGPGLALSQQLHMDWTLLTAGGIGWDAVHPLTAIEVLTADDDDGDLTNGTPNFIDICNAFITYNISCPPISLLGDREIDLQLPALPGKVASADIQIRAGGTSRFFVFSGPEKPALVSVTVNDLAAQRLNISELPSNAHVGSNSLFYMKDDTSTEFIFTDNTRTNFYLGQIAGGVATVQSSKCGPFGKISDIHIVESLADTPSRIIVADKGASKLYSYSINSTTSVFCSNEFELELSGVEWIRSDLSEGDEIVVGTKTRYGLQLHHLSATNLSTVRTPISLSTNREALYGRPQVDDASDDLLIPVQNSGDATNGEHFIYFYDIPSQSEVAYLSTCPNPKDVQIDYEGVNRYYYVFCPQTKLIYSYDTTRTVQQIMSAGQAPKQMLVGSDGTNRYIAVNQGIAEVFILEAPVGGGPFVGTSVALPARMDSLGQYASLDEAVLVSREGNLLSRVDLDTATLQDTLSFPDQVTSLAAESYSAMHFVSKTDDTAYELNEISSRYWTLQFTDVGTNPIQIAYRTNRAYALNQGSDNLSIINTAVTPHTVATGATEANPVHFDFDTTEDELWVVNQDSNSYTIFDISVGAEAILGDIPITFSPKKIRFETSDDTLYIAGEEDVLVVDQAGAFAEVKTETLPNTISDIVPITGGVTVTSKLGVDSHFVSRGAFTQTDLTSSPHALISNETISVAALLNESKFESSGGLSDTFTQSFSRIFSSPNFFYAYEPTAKSLQIFPYSLIASGNFPNLRMKITIDPQVTDSDTNGNIWMADSHTLRFQRLNSAQQRQTIENALINRPTDIKGWDLRDRIYVSVRNLNAVVTINATNFSMNIISVCEGPEKLALDTAASRLYALCPASNSFSLLTLDGSGDPSTIATIATNERPSDIEVNSTLSRLYVANKNSDNVSVYNSSTGVLITTVDTVKDPIAIAVDSANLVTVVGEGSTQYTQFPGATNVPTNVEGGIPGLKEVIALTTSDNIYATSQSARAFLNAAGITFSPVTSLVDNTSPKNLYANPANEKVIILYPVDGVVRLLNENALTQTDIDVGDSPSAMHIIEGDDRGYISHYEDDRLTILNLATNAIVANVELIEGCGPTQINSVDVGGTDYVYILCQKNDYVEILRGSDNTLITPLLMKVFD